MFKETCVHDCAATGVYVGGDGTTGEAVDCIVKGNGKGGERVMKTAWPWAALRLNRCSE